MQDFCGEEELLEAVFINLGRTLLFFCRGLEFATALNFDLRSSFIGDNLFEEV